MNRKRSTRKRDGEIRFVEFGVLIYSGARAGISFVPWRACEIIPTNGYKWILAGRGNSFGIRFQSNSNYVVTKRRLETKLISRWEAFKRHDKSTLAWVDVERQRRRKVNRLSPHFLSRASVQHSLHVKYRNWENSSGFLAFECLCKSGVNSRAGVSLIVSSLFLPLRSWYSNRSAAQEMEWRASVAAFPSLILITWLFN